MFTPVKISANRMSKCAILALIALSACTTPEEDRAQSFVGTQNGQSVHAFKAETAGFMMEKKLDANIRARATRICPAGYSEVSRTGAGTNLRYLNGVPVTYFLYDVTIHCPIAQ